MEKLPFLSSLACNGKRVIVRADLDVKIGDTGEVKDDSRLLELLPTLNWILEQGAARVVIIGHRGRPEGVFSKELSLEPLLAYFKARHHPDITFLPHKPLSEFFETFDEYSRTNSRVVLLENMRFYKEEEENAAVLAEQLSYFGDMYVNEAFASSHREHVSVSALPKLVKQKAAGSVALGLQFQAEIEHLSKLLTEPKHPVLFIISGAKDDKLTFLPQFKELADTVFIAGRLPEFMPEEQGDPKVVVARLNPDKEDITIHSIEQFEQTIASAGTIFVSGPIGKFEESGHMLGTQRVFTAIAKSGALKIAGGGDTTAAINALKLQKAFDWISSGGGASLEFIAKRTLPGIEALQ